MRVGGRLLLPGEDRIAERERRYCRDKEGYSSFIAGKQLMRHKSKDEYYIGDWDIAGYQKGQGILYRPGVLFYHGHFDTVPHGNGLLYDLQAGILYDGEFNHGNAEGHGKVSDFNNLYCYEGTISRSFEPVTGKLTVSDPQDGSPAYLVHFQNYPAMKARI